MVASVPDTDGQESAGSAVTRPSTRSETTSVGASLPFSSSLRRSRAPSRPAAVADSTETSSSPAACRRGKAGGGVDRVADHGQLDVVTLADRTEPDVACVDARTDRDPRPVWIVVSGGAQQGESGVDRAPGVVVAEDRREDGHQLVTHELVHKPVVREHRLRGGRVVPVQHGVELGRAHPFAEGRRAADVGEEHRAIHRGPAVVTKHDLLAGRAHPGVRGRLVLADDPHQPPAEAMEGRSAQLAARVGRDAREQRSRKCLQRVRVVQVLAPEGLVLCRVRRARIPARRRHRPSLRRRGKGLGLLAWPPGVPLASGTFGPSGLCGVSCTVRSTQPVEP